MERIKNWEIIYYDKYDNEIYREGFRGTRQECFYAANSTYQNNPQYNKYDRIEL